MKGLTMEDDFSMMDFVTDRVNQMYLDIRDRRVTSKECMLIRALVTLYDKRNEEGYQDDRKLSYVDGNSMCSVIFKRTGTDGA